MNRDELQQEAFEWARACFGDRAMGLKERAMRVLEEAIELAQAEGIEIERVRHLVDHVYAKPPGDAAQEVGGISVTLLCYCERKGIFADEQERKELNRVRSLPREHFAARHKAKGDAGITDILETENE